MIFFTPDIGTLLKLEEDWTFTLFLERRNIDLFEKLEQLNLQSGTRKNKVIDLPKGLVPKVDRIYIRKGLSQYSSISFKIPKPAGFGALAITVKPPPVTDPATKKYFAESERSTSEPR